MRVALTVYSICLLFHNTLGAVEKSGPYKTTLIRTERCEKPTLPLDKDPAMLIYIEVYNSTKRSNLFRGNVTIIRDTINKKIKVKGYYWEDGQWKIHYIMNNLGCHNLILPVMAAVAGIKYDRKNCKFFKGQYIFSNVDANTIQHNWMTEQEYGKIKWISEVFSQTGTVACWEYETVVEPII